MKVEIDKDSGFCQGVVEAIRKAEDSLAGGGTVYSLGDIVHNLPEVRRLEALGLRTVSHSDLPRLSGRRLLIRAHGEPPSTFRNARECGIEVIDATCSVVAGIQRLVRHADEQMQKCGGQVVILGKKGHAEVTGLVGQTEGRAIVVEGHDDLGEIDFARPVFFLSQTTQSRRLFGKMAEEISSRAADPDKVTVRDTICRRVASREERLTSFAERFDAVVFVCGRKSSNGRVLSAVCRTANMKCYNVEGPEELRREWFAGCRSVGVCGATSTPQWLMESVRDKIIALCSAF